VTKTESWLLLLEQKGEETAMRKSESWAVTKNRHHLLRLRQWSRELPTHLLLHSSRSFVFGRMSLDASIANSS
jgi:hypothetical protein